ncbi:IS3 family transposase [Streptococcus equi subsp. equi]|nr:IS3 family transposase [Streptococcus equi subsp. equi]
MANYGYRRIHLELRNRGFIVNHQKVQRLMTVMGLKARIRRKRKYSSYKGEVGKKADNLIKRQFEGSNPTRSAIPIGRNLPYLRGNSIDEFPLR